MLHRKQNWPFLTIISKEKWTIQDNYTKRFVFMKIITTDLYKLPGNKKKCTFKTVS